MTTTQSTAKINAYKALSDELVALGATNGEIADAMAKWSDLVSGRRPAYYANHCKVVDEFRAEKGLPEIERPGKAQPAPVAPEIDEAAFEAAAPVEKPAKGKGKTAKTASKPAPKATKVSTPKPEKAPARKVESVRNTPGAFLRQRRLVRRSRTVVSLWDLSHEDAAKKFGTVTLPGTDTPAKYLVLCEDHDAKQGVKNYESAWRAGLDPATICPACAKAAKKAEKASA